MTEFEQQVAEALHLSIEGGPVFDSRAFATHLAPRVAAAIEAAASRAALVGAPNAKEVELTFDAALAALRGDAP